MSASCTQILTKLIKTRLATLRRIFGSILLFRTIFLRYIIITLSIIITQFEIEIYEIAIRTVPFNKPTHFRHEIIQPFS